MLLDWQLCRVRSLLTDFVDGDLSVGVEVYGGVVADAPHEPGSGHFLEHELLVLVEQNRARQHLLYQQFVPLAVLRDLECVAHDEDVLVHKVQKHHVLRLTVLI